MIFTTREKTAGAGVASTGLVSGLLAAQVVLSRRQKGVRQRKRTTRRVGERRVGVEGRSLSALSLLKNGVDRFLSLLGEAFAFQPEGSD